MGSGLVGLHKEGVLTDESLTIPRNWLSLGGAVSPGSARQRCQSIRDTRLAERGQLEACADCLLDFAHVPFPLLTFTVINGNYEYNSFSEFCESV